MEPSILVAHRDGYAEITLNRPERLNAFTVDMHVALRAALEAAASDPACRAVLLTGQGRGFSAGQDLTARAQPTDGSASPPDLGVTLETYYNPLIRLIRTMPKPVIVAVNGVAAGAGANIALAGDIVIAAKSAKFIQAFAKIGLIPDAGGTFILPRLIGMARATALMMTGEPIPAETAADWGMIWKAVDDADLVATTRALAAQLATQPTQGFALLKQALNASAGHSLEEQLTVERDLQRRAGLTPDYAEGVRAFLEKRPAHFTGRPA